MSSGFFHLYKSRVHKTLPENSLCVRPIQIKNGQKIIHPTPPPPTLCEVSIGVLWTPTYTLSKVLVIYGCCFTTWFDLIWYDMRGKHIFSLVTLHPTKMKRSLHHFHHIVPKNYFGVVQLCSIIKGWISKRWNTKI